MAHDEGSTRRDVRKPRQPRHAVRVRAVLHAHGKCRRIDIIDYSQHGFKLDRASGIGPHERVTVELPSGHRLPMRVVWIKGGEAGVRFLAAIAPEHPVMHSLDEAARNYKLRRRARSGQHSGHGSRRRSLAGA